MAGRFAPSPTGDLHIGNLRTALVSALLAYTTGREFIIRMEDLDLVTASLEFEERQIADLAAVGVVTSAEIVRQSERFELYRNAIDRLTKSGDAYPCYCSRREIRAEIEAAAQAPNGNLPDGAYPGTCRNLTTAQRSEREAEGRRPALRLRTSGETYVVDDMVAGRFEGGIDDVVLARADGVPAYNLAVVVDDATQGVDQVVRGDDLLSSTPRQMHLQHLLGLPTPEYAEWCCFRGAEAGASVRQDDPKNSVRPFRNQAFARRNTILGGQCGTRAAPSRLKMMNACPLQQVDP
mgnify:CR=1 FL=1